MIIADVVLGQHVDLPIIVINKETAISIFLLSQSVSTFVCVLCFVLTFFAFNSMCIIYIIEIIYT